MQSCSVHHCVLFLLTLTFTTAPASAAVFPVYATLHQPVTLPCEKDCSPKLAQWTLTSTRDVFAQCDKTSCRSLKDGYEMSHDGYLKGDLSLTITKPDYSMRETYACECGYLDYATWRLRIFTVFSAVQVKTEGDLKLDLSVPEPVEVIYRGSVLAAGEQICTVTNSSLQCKAEYTPRTSLSYPELTLRHLGRSETGTYTIRNLDYKEEIRVYAVSVSGLTKGETTVIVIVVLLLVGLITGVMMYIKIKAVWKSREVKSEMNEVDELIKELIKQENKDKEEQLMKQAEQKIDALQQKYRDDKEYYEDIELFCTSKRLKLTLCGHELSPIPSLEPVTGEMKCQKEEVDELMKQITHKPAEVKEVIKQVEEKVEALEKKYRDDSRHSEHVTLFCNSKRLQLREYREMFTEKRSLELVTEEVKKQMDNVDDLINEAVQKTRGEQKKAMQKVLHEINQLEMKYSQICYSYRRVSSFFMNKREEVEFCKKFYGTQMTSLQSGTGEQVKSLMDEVDELINKVKVINHNPKLMKEDMKAVVEKINALSEMYGGEQCEYSEHVKTFKYVKTEELDLYRDMFETSLLSDTKQQVKILMEEVDELINKVKVINHNPAEVEAVEKKIEELEQEMSQRRSCYRLVRSFCYCKRIELEMYSKLYGIRLGFESPNAEEVREEVLKIIKDFKWKADQKRTVPPELLSEMYDWGRLCLLWIYNRCIEQREELYTVKDHLSGELKDDLMLENMETRVNELELWCAGKECELEVYKNKLQRGGSKVDPKTPQNKGEGVALLEVKTK